MDLDIASPPSFRVIQRETTDVRLRGRALVLARAGWLITAALAVALFVASIPPYYADMVALSGPHMEWSPDSVRAGLEQLGIPLRAYAAYNAAIMLALSTACVVSGALIFWRKPDDRAALYFSLTLVVFGAVWPNTLDSLARLHPGLEPIKDALYSWSFTSFFLLFYLFPDGRFVPRWTRWAAVVFVADVVLADHFPSSPLATANWPLPLGIPYFAFLLGSVLVAPIYRYRRASGPVQRQQIKWVVYGLVVALVSFLGFGQLSTLPALNQPGVPAALMALASPVAFGVVFMLVPASIGIAVLRYRLWDIDPIGNRALVYGALTAIVVGLYIVTVGFLGALFRTDANLLFSLVATGFVAVLFQPVRDRLQRAVNRLMYGERDEPYRVLSRLGERLETVLTPEQVLPTIVESVRDALKLPYVAVALRWGEGFAVAATSGEPVDEPLRLPLVHQHEAVGELLLAPRARGEDFGTAERRLLDDLARQAGVAAHAVRLAADLQRSRERLVTAREEERRRLRRDLHDGLGAQLAALNIQAGLLRHLIHRDPTAADAGVAELRAELRAAIADIRRLIHDLRPSALDELGLVAALHQLAAQYDLGAIASRDLGAESEEGSVRVSVNAPDELPHLLAAVEVAVYRIAQEALTNVARHAHARRCVVRLDITEELHLEVEDDGIGLAAGYAAGVGLLSMRERAAELGGTCVVQSVPSGGTSLVVRLPLSGR